MKHLFDIVVVNWNAGALLRACVTSVDEHHGGLVERLIVVDNGSTDGSDRVSTSSVSLDLVRAGENLGFARACNRGAARGRAPWILFLNPDGRLFADTLPHLARALADAPADLGAAGIRLVGSDGRTQRHTARHPRPSMFLSVAFGLHRLAPRHFSWVTDEAFDHESSRDVAHVIGAFYAVRRPLFEALGGFDERFFVYFEDLDLSMRLRQAGYRLHYFADVKAMHHGGGTSAQVKAFRTYLSRASRTVFAVKHFPTVPALAITLATLVAEPVVWVAERLARRDPKGALEVLQAWRWLWLRAPATWRRGRAARAAPGGPAVSSNSSTNRGAHTSSE